MVSIINIMRAKIKTQPMPIILACLIASGIAFSSVPLLAEEIEEVEIEEEDMSYKEMLHRDKLLIKELQVEQKRRDKLTIVEKKEERRQIQSQTSALIREGKIAYSKRQYDEAREAFYSVLDIDPQNKTALNYLKLIRIRIDKEKAVALKRKTEELYREGIKNYKQKDYESAIENFLQVNNLIPDYKKANYYLDMSEKNIKKERFRESELGPEEEVSIREVEEEIVGEEIEVEIVEPREQEIVIEEKIEIKEEIKYKTEEETVQAQLSNREKLLQQKQEIEALIEEAKALYSDQMNNAAREKFEEVLEIDPKNRIALNYIDIITGKTEVEEVIEEKEIVGTPEVKAQGMYDAALSLYKKRDYESAREIFIELNGFYPAYKKTVYYLTKIDEILGKEKAKKESLLTKEERRKKKEQINEISEEANAFYRNNEYDKAKEKYQQILEIDEENRNAKKYIKVIDARIKEEELASLRDQTEALYKEAISLYKKRDYIAAKDKFLEVNGLYAGYKKTDTYLKKIDKIIQKKGITQEKKISEVKDTEPKKETKPSTKEKGKKDLTVKAEPIYQEAIQLYEDKDYGSAREKFLDVNDIYFDYKRTNYYLGKIEEALLKKLDEKIKTKQEKIKVKKEREIYTAQEKEEELAEAAERIRSEYELKADKLQRQWEEEFSRKEKRIESQRVSGQIIREEEVIKAREVFLEEQTSVEDVKIDITQDIDSEEVMMREDIEVTEEDINLRKVKENIERAKSRYQEAGMILEEVEEGLGEMDIEERQIQAKIEAMQAKEEAEDEEAIDLYEAKERIERVRKSYEQAGRMIDELDAQIQELPEDEEIVEETAVREIGGYGDVEITEEVSLDKVKNQLEQTKESYREVEDILDNIDEELGAINE